MAMPDLTNMNGFNADEVEDTNMDFDALPAGEYKMIITGAEQKENKAKTGSYLNLTLEVIGEQYAGRKVWDILNLDNPSEMAVKIARGTLASICKAVGVIKPKLVEELFDKPLIANLTVTEYNGSQKNEIKGYKSSKGSSKSPSPSATSSDSGDQSRPWG